MRNGVDPDLFEPNPGHQNCNPEGISFLSLVREDFDAHGRYYFSHGFWAIFWHRFGNWRMDIQPTLLRYPFNLVYRIMYAASQIISGIMVPYTTRVGRRVRLEHFGGMVLVAQAIGDDVIVRQNTTFGISGLDDLMARPVIGNRVEIGTGAIILGNTYVGEDSIIGANAVVTKDVPPNSIAVGVPVRTRPRFKT